MKSFFIENENLRLFIYVVGYPEMGESQIIVIKDVVSNVIYFSGVVDCYVHDGLNETENTLSNLGITELDFLCWTHPDADHSVGLSDIVRRFCTVKTSIFLSEGINGSANDLITYNQEARDFFDAIANNNANRHYNVNSVTVSPGNGSTLVQMKFSTLTYAIKFSITSIAPISAIARRRILSESLHDKNDISAALIVELGEIKLLLAGDVLNSTINQFDTDYLSGLTYIKTPHHTSTSSDRLLYKLDQVEEFEKVPITCTTGYRKHDLPSEVLIEKYKSYTESFYSTCDSNGSHEFGMVCIELNPFDRKYDESLTGNAIRLY